MKIWLLIITLSMLTACKPAETPKSAETIQAEKPLTIGNDKTYSGESFPNEIKVRVTISRPEDLRVSVGEKINVGDVIADRKRERDALLMQKQQAEFALERMKKLMYLKDENLEKPVLPDASFAEYEASINRASIAVESAKRAISLQESRIVQIESLPFPVDLTKVKQHEAARLNLLKSELLAAESNLNLERAKLETAKANRNYTEQKDQLEINKSKITAREQRITIEAQITQIEATITNLNVQIVALSAVRAPFAGTIKKINWEGQTNAEINVVITVDVDDLTANLKAQNNELPCFDSSEICVEKLTAQAVANSEEIRVLDQTIKLAKRKGWTQYIDVSALDPLTMSVQILRNIFGGGERQQRKLSIAQIELRRTETVSRIRTEISNLLIEAENAERKRLQSKMLYDAQIVARRRSRSLLQKRRTFDRTNDARLGKTRLFQNRNSNR